MSPLHRAGLVSDKGCSGQSTNPASFNLWIPFHSDASELHAPLVLANLLPSTGWQEEPVLPTLARSEYHKGQYWLCLPNCDTSSDLEGTLSSSSSRGGLGGP